MVNIVTLGGTVPSSLWPRGKTVLPRRRPASSGLRNKRLQTNVAHLLQKLLNKCMEKSNPLAYMIILMNLWSAQINQTGGGGGQIVWLNFIDLTWL